MTGIDDWLKQIGLGIYADAFIANDIGLDVLPSLTAEDLVELGVVSVGHKRILLNAISSLMPEPLRQGNPDRAAPEIAGERRPVTILFADLSGYTRLSGQLGSEQTHDLLQQYYSIADGVIVGNGGHVDKHIGDSVMGIFGAPVAHGNDAERAVLAALSIISAMPDLSRKSGVEVDAHVGIAFGEVVAAMSGSATHAAYTVVGDAVNVAARLTGIARSGEILITDAVQRQLDGKVISVDLGAMELKGVVEPVQAWRVSELAPSRQMLERRMVGRAPELAQMRALLEQVHTSRSGACVHVRGEPGIGKSRFANELAIIAKDSGFEVIMTGFLDFGEELARDAIRTIALALAGDGQALPPDINVFIKDLLGSPLDETERARLAGANLQARLEGRAEALKLATMARTGPKVILVEDLHWADERQFELLCRYVSRLSDQPVLFVTTARPECEPLRLQGEGAAMSLSLMDLGPLRPDEARQMAAELVKSNPELTAELITRSGGNPLFLEHLLSFPAGPSSSSVPDTLRNLVLAGADRLTPDLRSVLQAAAVLGQKGSLESLRMVLGRPGVGHLQLPQRFLRSDEDGVFRFTHALVRDAIYQSILSGNRHGIHLRAAAHFRDRDKALFAQHLEMANDPGAASAFLEAARHAYQDLAFERAVQLARSGIAAAKGHETAELECVAGQALLALGRTAEAVAAFETAEKSAAGTLGVAAARLGLAGALRVGDQLDRAAALLDQVVPMLEESKDFKNLSEAWHLRGNLYFPKGLHEKCAEAHEHALENARLANSVPHLARALSGQADAAYAAGRLVTAAGKFEECVALARANGFMDIAAANANMAVIARNFAGMGADAAEKAAEAIVLAREVGLPRAEIIAHHAAMCHALWSGRPEELDSLFERAQQLSEQIGAKRFMAENLAFFGESMRMRGRMEEAERLLSDGLSLSREFGMDYIGPVILGYMAQLYANEPERQHALLSEGEEIVSRSGLAHNKLFFNSSAIECYLDAGNHDAVERHAVLLEQGFAAEEIPIITFLAQRARILCRIARGEVTKFDAELVRLHQLGKQIGFSALCSRLENS